MDKQQFECFTLSPLDGRYAGIKDALFFLNLTKIT